MAKPAAKVKASEYRNYIGGQWVAPFSGEYIENRNPADSRDLVGRFPASTEEDVNRAVAAAAEAFSKWRKVPAPRRAEILFKAGEILIRRKEEFARAMTREMGKVFKEASGDVQEAIDMSYFIAGEGRRLHGFTTKAELPNKFAMCVREPIGVCGLITPWNFPMAIPS
ncbi:MAG TPA: aldehyde dehydrogenase family protein, partial [Blastocatellia bacterium]